MINTTLGLNILIYKLNEGGTCVVTGLAENIIKVLNDFNNVYNGKARKLVIVRVSDPNDSNFINIIDTFRNQYNFIMVVDKTSPYDNYAFNEIAKYGFTEITLNNKTLMLFNNRQGRKLIKYLNECEEY